MIIRSDSGQPKSNSGEPQSWSSATKSASQSYFMTTQKGVMPDAGTQSVPTKFEKEGGDASSQNTHPSPFLKTEPVSEVVREVQVKVCKRSQRQLY